MDDEVWKSFRDTRYDVSNKGRVRSTSRPDASGNIRKKNIGVMSQKITNRGYAQVPISGKYFMVHRMVAELFVDNLRHPETKLSELVVDHIDNNPLNNTSDNLQRLTSSENIKKAHDEGLVPEKTDEVKRAQGDRFRRINEEHKKEILIVSKDDGKTYIFGSATEASLKFGYDRGYFSRIVRNGGENSYWKASYIS